MRQLKWITLFVVILLTACAPSATPPQMFLQRIPDSWEDQTFFSTYNQESGTWVSAANKSSWTIILASDYRRKMIIIMSSTGHSIQFPRPWFGWQYTASQQPSLETIQQVVGQMYGAAVIYPQLNGTVSIESLFPAIQAPEFTPPPDWEYGGSFDQVKTTVITTRMDQAIVAIYRDVNNRVRDRFADGGVKMSISGVAGSYYYIPRAKPSEEDFKYANRFIDGAPRCGLYNVYHGDLSHPEWDMSDNSSHWDSVCEGQLGVFPTSSTPVKIGSDSGWMLTRIKKYNPAEEILIGTGPGIYIMVDRAWEFTISATSQRPTPAWLQTNFYSSYGKLPYLEIEAGEYPLLPPGITLVP